MKEEYTREKLIKICEKAFVPQDKWMDRDSASAQTQLGECYALLKAGCYFEIQYTKDKSGCNTNDRTIWIQFWVHNFSWFEYHEDDNLKGYKDSDYHFYLPTELRLKECKGKDWY